VVDEAQNVKNAGTRQARAIRALPAARRVAMTGTPVENRLSELWSIMEFLNPGLLGSENGFRSRFALPIERYGDEDAAGRLRRLTQPFLLRRVKTDRAIIKDLPDKLEMKVFCNLTREQASLYQAVVDRARRTSRTWCCASLERRPPRPAGVPFRARWPRCTGRWPATPRGAPWSGRIGPSPRPRRRRGGLRRRRPGRRRRPHRLPGAGGRGARRGRGWWCRREARAGCGGAESATPHGLRSGMWMSSSSAASRSGVHEPKKPSLSIGVAS
jgi:hypothetical protein